MDNLLSFNKSSKDSISTSIFTLNIISIELFHHKSVLEGIYILLLLLCLPVGNNPLSSLLPNKEFVLSISITLLFNMSKILDKLASSSFFFYLL